MMRVSIRRLSYIVTTIPLLCVTVGRAAAEPAVPAIIAVPVARLASVFRPDPDYRRGNATATVSVVGAFEVTGTGGTWLVDGWAPGYLPVTLAFSDGSCRSLQADYVDGVLANGRLVPTDCERKRRDRNDAPPVPPPSRRKLRFVGAAWGHAAWADDRAGSTIVTAPARAGERGRSLFTAAMRTIAITAIGGPDTPTANITMVGRIGGRATVVVLRVAY